MGQKILAVLTGDHSKEVFFLQENVWSFCRVAVITRWRRITEIAVMRGSTVFIQFMWLLINYFLAPGKVRWFEMFEFKVLLKT